MLDIHESQNLHIYKYQSETFHQEPSGSVATTYSMGYDASQHGTSGPQNVSFPGKSTEHIQYVAGNSLAD